MILAWASAAAAQTPALPQTLSIERSTAPAKLGQRATLTVGLLKRKGDQFVGSYTITVAPLPLANESGSLAVRIPHEALARQDPLAFSGSATNDSGKARTINGLATPAGTDRGAVRLEIHSEHGILKYDTAYRLR